MSEGDRRQRLERILKDAEPALDQPSGYSKTVGIGDIAGQANQVVVGNENIVITDSRRDTKQMQPLRRAIRLLCMGMIILCVPLLFCVERTQPPAIVITIPITANAPDQPPTFQRANQLAPQPGFHVHAGCSFLKPPRPIDPATGAKPQSI